MALNNLTISKFCGSAGILDSPCFVFEEERMKTGYVSFSEALFRNGIKGLLGYSVKTNSFPGLLIRARELGCMAEVVSDDELDLALLCGYTKKDIVFNGPMKSKERFLEIIEAGGIVNIETHRELGWLKDLPKGRNYKVGLRVSINVSRVSPEDADGEDDFSRFGFNDETSELNDAINYINSLGNVKLAGLHLHRTTQSRSPRFYSRLVGYASLIIDKYNLDLEYLDLGGGYFGIFKGAPTFEDYAAALKTSLRSAGLENLRIILEPGNALSASSFSFWTRVIDVKNYSDKRIVTTDGSRIWVDPFFRKEHYLTEIYRINETDYKVPLQIVCGSTCLEYDQLFRLTDSEPLERGDIIKYNNVGAYTMTLSPLFINYFPKVYAMDKDGNLKLLREKWTASELISKCEL